MNANFSRATGGLVTEVYSGCGFPEMKLSDPVQMIGHERKLSARDASGRTFSPPATQPYKPVLFTLNVRTP